MNSPNDAVTLLNTLEWAEDSLTAIKSLHGGRHWTVDLVHILVDARKQLAWSGPCTITFEHCLEVRVTNDVRDSARCRGTFGHV